MFTNISKIFILYSLYTYTLKWFNAIIFKKVNKICINDTLFSLYTLSSSTSTIWLFFVVLILISLWSSKFCQPLLFCIYIYIWFYFLQYNIDITIVVSVLNTQAINTTLQNGLLNIHPIFVYVTYAAITLFWCKDYFNRNIQSSITGTVSVIFIFLSIILIGIYLGAFWASQELSWGGFWSWDPVEVVSLFLFFWFLSYMHNRTAKILNKPTNHVIIGILIIYFIIRLGVINTIHSFIRNNNQPYFIRIVLLSIYVIVSKNFINYYHVVKARYTTRNLITWCMATICLYIYIWMIINWSLVININPITVYFLMVLLYTLATFVDNLFKWNKLTAIQALITSAFILITQTNGFILNFTLLYFCIFLNIKNVRLHALMLYIYAIFFVFFVSIPLYSANKINYVYVNYNLTMITNTTTLKEYYESFFHLRKHITCCKIKNMWFHVTGFSIPTNNIVSLYVFTKNNEMYFLFALEIVFLIGFYLFLLFGFNFFNYKYFRVHSTYKVESISY